MKTLFTSVLLTLALAAPFGFAQSYDSAGFQQARASYDQVSDGSGSAKQLTEQWQRLYQQDESDPLLLVFLGSSRTMVGRDALMPWNKLSHTEQGLEEMAVAQRLLREEHKQIQFEGMPLDLNVKVYAGITFTQVPESFGRLEQGYYLLSDVLADERFQRLYPQQQTYVYYFAITAAQQLNRPAEVKQWQAKLQQLNSNDDYSQAALKIGGE